MAADWSNVVRDAEARVDRGGVYKRLWRTLKSEAGASNVTREERRHLVAILRGADTALGIHPPVDEIDVAGNDWVVIDRLDRTLVKQQAVFASESDLEDFIEAAMPYFPGLLGVESVGRQVMLGTKVRRPCPPLCS
jgi:hypothetical protein